MEFFDLWLLSEWVSNEATEIYEAMEKCEGMTPNLGTLVSVLPACSHVGALRKGMTIHGRAIQVGLELDVFVGTCLTDMCAKCGRLEEAMFLIDQVPRRSSCPWNAIIAGLGVHGHREKALRLFEEMQQEGVRPDSVTFISITLCLQPLRISLSWSQVLSTYEVEIWHGATSETLVLHGGLARSSWTLE